VSFSADALFGFGKSTIRPEGTSALDKFASELMGANYDLVHIYGYTDRIGSDEYNLKLSRQRAEIVESYLVSKGVPAVKIDAEGRGKADPVTKPGECEGNRSAKVIACLQPDRRVDIEVSGEKR
jgi:OOP family OmpA-OmpF porin